MTYLQPLLLLFLILGFIGLTRLRHAKGYWLVAVSIIGILLLSWHPTTWVASRLLQARYPIRALPIAPAQAIVVLSSSVSPPLYERPYPLPDRETYQRCQFAAWLHKNWLPLPVLVSGGAEVNARQAVSVTMRELLERTGIPEAMIWTEEQSRSTYENALFGGKVLRSHGINSIVLVVEAWGMPRAAACFRKQGFTVIPAPCEFMQPEPPMLEFIPSWLAIKRNEEMLHETIGLAWYWLRGWI